MRVNGRARTSCWLVVALAIPAASAPAASAGVADPVQAAAAKRFAPGSFAIRGKAPATGAGKTVSVHLSPQSVGLAGCRTMRARLRSRKGLVTLRSTHRCGSGTVKLVATVRGQTLRGTAQSGSKRRRIVARRVAARGVSLKGNASAPATSVIGAVGMADRYLPAEVLTVGRLRVARRELIVELKPAATVGQVNALLRFAGGGITSSVRAFGVILVGIPDAGTAKALRAVAAALAKRPGVARVDLSPMAAEDALPPSVASPPTAAQRDAISQLLPTGIAAALNARAAADPQRAPLIVVTDSFGGRALSSTTFPHIDAAHQSAPAEYTVGPKRVNGLRLTPSDHGYHVTGIALGDFANDGTPAGLVTGSLGIRPRLLALDTIAGSIKTSMDAMINAAEGATGPVILTSSLGLETNDSLIAARLGAEWIAAVRRTNLEVRVLHTVSAGNDGAAALDNSPWTKASLGRDFVDANDDPLQLDPLVNTLAVENLQESTDGSEFVCLADTSNSGGHIATAGSDVYSFDRNGAPVDKSGTSMATPLMAGVAAFLWSIAPDITPAQLRTAISVNARTLSGCERQAAPVLDAYAAVLSLDQATLPGRTEYPVRMALLDLTGDLRFTEADLEQWAPKIDPARQAAARDWSRHDLNGDGFTGGGGKAGFDLDRVGSFRGGQTTLGDVRFEVADRTLDERSLTDADILCFYAYSPLYSVSTTSTDKRAALLDPLEGCEAKARKIAFASTREGGDVGDYDIYVMNADGTDVKNITQSAGEDNSPAWSPDGTQIAFESRRGGGLHVWVMSANGANPRQLTTFTSYQPAWSPDGKRLAFTSGRDGTDDVLVMNADGTGEAVNLTNTGSCCDRYPAFSPDGLRMAFTSSRTGNDEIYVMNADGTGTPQNITHNPVSGENPGIDQDPMWSPDGRRISFTSLRDNAGGYEVFVMNDNGTGLVNVSNSAGTDAYASWSADGQSLAFLSERAGGLPEIYVMKADGTNVERRTTNEFNDIMPDW